MIARRRMAGRRVARAAVGTAVVAGTAGAVRHHQDQRYARQDAQNQAEYEAEMQQQAYDQQQYAAPPPQQAAPVQAEDPITQIQRLGELKEQGLLTEEEFAAQKAKILGT